MFIERLWRTVKYEDIYIRGYETVPELELRRIRAPWGAAASAIIVESVFRRRPRPDWLAVFAAGGLPFGRGDFAGFHHLLEPT
jgi:hypothetical protein